MFLKHEVVISTKLLLYVFISNLFVVLKTICVPIVHEARPDAAGEGVQGIEERDWG